MPCQKLVFYNNTYSPQCKEIIIHLLTLITYKHLDIRNILKLKSIARVTSGLSKYYELSDVSGKYSSTNSFGSDGALYEQNNLPTFDFTWLTTNDISNIVVNRVQPVLAEFATKQFLKIGLLSNGEVKNEDKENRAYRKYLYHGISHHLGIDVHDIGTRTEPIQAGMVFTIEPGIYIEEEKMGIRIENNYWITHLPYILGWSFGIWGIALYLLTGVEYIAKGVRMTK